MGLTVRIRKWMNRNQDIPLCKECGRVKGVRYPSDKYALSGIYQCLICFDDEYYKKWDEIRSQYWRGMRNEMQNL